MSCEFHNVHIYASRGKEIAIDLADIVEKDSNAWIKISTAFNPELSMYTNTDIPSGTEGIVVKFKVSGMDCESAELYWCYQIISGGNIEKIESLQIVFPGLTETTTTKFEVTEALYITDANDVAAYTTGSDEYNKKYEM